MFRYLQLLKILWLLHIFNQVNILNIITLVCLDTSLVYSSCSVGQKSPTFAKKYDFLFLSGQLEEIKVSIPTIFIQTELNVLQTERNKDHFSFN